MLRTKLKAILMTQKRDDLPTGYKRVKYIESSGTQWIDTKVMCKDIETVEMRFAVTEYLATGAGVNGILATNNGGYDLKIWIRSDGAIRLTYGGTGIGTIKVFSKFPTEFTVIKVTKNGAIVDGEELPYLANENNNKIFAALFCAKENAVAQSNYSASKIDYVKINDGKTADLVACLDESNRPCFYDKARKQTFYNQGIGEFKYAI